MQLPDPLISLLYLLPSFQFSQRLGILFLLLLLVFLFLLSQVLSYYLVNLRCRLAARLRAQVVLDVEGLVRVLGEAYETFGTEGLRQLLGRSGDRCCIAFLDGERCVVLASTLGLVAGQARRRVPTA